MDMDALLLLVDQDKALAFLNPLELPLHFLGILLVCKFLGEGRCIYILHTCC
jgi:hypothetical protein